MKINQKTFIFLAVLPLIYIATSLQTALYSGLVLLISSLIIKALSMGLEKVGSGRFLIYSYMIVTATIIGISSMIFDAFFTVESEVALYLALLIVNGAIIFSKQEDETFTNHLISTLLSFVCIIAIGLFRELLGLGTISLIFGEHQIISKDFVLSMLVAPAGGFIMAGIVFAIYQKVYLMKEGENNVI